MCVGQAIGEKYNHKHYCRFMLYTYCTKVRLTCKVQRCKCRCKRTCERLDLILMGYKLLFCLNLCLQYRLVCSSNVCQMSKPLDMSLKNEIAIVYSAYCIPSLSQVKKHYHITKRSHYNKITIPIRLYILTPQSFLIMMLNLDSAHYHSVTEGCLYL